MRWCASEVNERSCVCVIVIVRGRTQPGLDGGPGWLNRPQVVQLANGILPTQGGLWRREAKTEAALLGPVVLLWVGTPPPPSPAPQ